MNVKALFPFGVRADQNAIGADTLTVLTAGIHLDRRKARQLGWRGLRPSMGVSYSWTMRLVGQAGIYGLSFLDEQRHSNALYARFGAFYFPDPEEPILHQYLPKAYAMAQGSEYFTHVRDFARWEESQLFFLGFMRLDIALDLSGLSLSMECPTRQRVLALDEMPEADLRSGDLACNIPALRLGTSLLRLLGLSAASLLESSPDWQLSRTRYPLMAFTADGEWGTMQGQYTAGGILAANFGERPTLCVDTKIFRSRQIPHRYFEARETQFEDNRPVLHIVSGFLGSGKTTFLAEWLAWLHNHDRHTTVLQNELGAINLDSVLLKHETVSESLDEGCVCCTLADSLRPAIARLMAKLPTEQIILETTGLANPGAVADALENLRDIIRPGLRISLLDSLAFGEGDASHTPSGLATEQIRQATILVCNKVDLIGPDELEKIIIRLKKLNPSAPIFTSKHGRIPFGEMDRLCDNTSGPGALAATALHPRQHVTHRDEGYSALVFNVSNALDAKTLADIVSFAQDRTPRIKGVIDSVEENRPQIVQYTARVLSLEDPLSDPGPSRFLVFIGKNMDDKFVAGLEDFTILRKA